MARKSRKQPEKPHRSIEQTLDLPEILSPGVPHIEMQGNREIIIDGCRGILEYDEDRIKLNAGSLVITFQGSGLVIKTYSENQTVLAGEVVGLAFEN